MIKSLIPFFFQTNLSFAFPQVSLVVSILSIFLLLDKTSIQQKPRSVSSLVIPDFNEVIVATPLIHIDILSLPMSPFWRTLICSLPPTLPVLMSYLYPLFIPSWLPHPYLQLLHLDHCKAYIRCPRTDIGSPTNSSPIVPSSTTPILPSPIDLPIAIRNGTRSSRNPHPIYNFLILLLFPPCFPFLFLKLCMRHSLIQAGNRQWSKKWLLGILLAHRT